MATMQPICATTHASSSLWSRVPKPGPRCALSPRSRGWKTWPTPSSKRRPGSPSRCRRPAHSKGSCACSSTPSPRQDRPDACAPRSSRNRNHRPITSKRPAVSTGAKAPVAHESHAQREAHEPKHKSDHGELWRLNGSRSY